MSENFSVILYGEFTIRLKQLEAESPKAAMDAAVAHVQAMRPSLDDKLGQDDIAPGVMYVCFEDNQVNGALVDFPNDPEHSKSVFLNEYGHAEYSSDVNDCATSTFPELRDAAIKLGVVKRGLEGDWLARRVEAAIAEIREIARVIKLREDEDNQD